MRLSCFFTLGVLPYIYLPLASLAGVARWSWGDQSTASGFFHHVLRADYGTFQLGKDSEHSGFVNVLMLEHLQILIIIFSILHPITNTSFSFYFLFRSYFAHCNLNFHSIGLPLAFIGIIANTLNYK